MNAACLRYQHLAAVMAGTRDPSVPEFIGNTLNPLFEHGFTRELLGFMKERLDNLLKRTKKVVVDEAIKSLDTTLHTHNPDDGGSDAQWAALSAAAADQSRDEKDATHKEKLELMLKQMCALLKVRLKACALTLHNWSLTRELVRPGAPHRVRREHL